MHKIFSLIESKKIEEFKSLIAQDADILNEVDDDGWSVLNSCIEYQMHDFVSFIAPLLTLEQIKTQKPTHPVEVCIRNDHQISFDFLLNLPNMDLNYVDKSNESLLFPAFYASNDEYFKKLIAAGLDPYKRNNGGVSAMSLCIAKSRNNLLDTFYDPIVLQEQYDELFIKKAIQSNNSYAFDFLFPYTKLEQDTLFSLAIDFKNPYVISKVMEMEGFIPGHDQIRDLTELMCTKTEDKKEKQAVDEIIDYLFAIKTPFNQFVNKAGQSAWMLSIENDNVDVFNKLIKTSESVNLTDAENHSPLMYAIEHDKPEFVSLLLKRKANPNHVDRYKNTPLIKAVKKNNREIIQELLKYPTHINEVNQNNETALNLAVKFKRMGIVSDLIWAGAELVNNPAQFVKEENIFHFNSNNEYEKLLTNFDEQTIDNFVALSQMGFDLNQKNTDGDCFIHHFIKNGFLANFKTLMKCSFNPNQLDANNNTPAMCAMNKNSNAYIESLFNKFSNIDLTIKNTSDENIYDLCLKHKRADRMELLVKYDDFLSPENARKSIFFLAQNGRLEDSWDKLQKNLKNINIKDDFGNNLLMLCIAGDNKKDYDFILKNNYYSNLKDKNLNQQSVYNLIELLPPDKKSEYKESLLYYSQMNDTMNKKPS